MLAEDIANHAKYYGDDAGAKATLVQRKAQVGAALAKSKTLLAETMNDLRNWTSGVRDGTRALPRGVMRDAVARTFATAGRGQSVPEPFTALIREFCGDMARLMPVSETAVAARAQPRSGGGGAAARAPPRPPPGHPMTEVSVLLCTVTLYANLAHSLTRSP
jgi:hypothetical protein